MKYPKQALIACATPKNTSPVTDIYTIAIQIKNDTARFRFAEVALQIPHQYSYLAHTKTYFDYLASRNGHLESKGLDFWNFLENLNDGGAAALINQSGELKESVQNIYTEKGKINKEEYSEAFKIRWVPLLIKLSKAGVGSASNTLGAMAMRGELKNIDKKEAVNLFLKAAQDGSLYAYFNLIKLPDHLKKGMISKEEIIKNLMAKCEKSSANVLYWMAMLIKYNRHGDLETEMKVLGQTIADLAAAKGHPDAKQY
jgi:TPR repeat protein